jgi:hypothetical protein
MPACVKNDCSGAEASIRIPGYRNLDEILIYDIRSANVWWNADDKQAERQYMLEWTGRTREWKEDNRESPDLMICAGHFTESQIKDGRRIPGELPHNHPIPVGHDLSKPLPDFRKPRTEEVIAARRAEAEEAAESRRQKAQAAVAARAEREEELRMAAVAQEMDDKLDAEVNWVVAEILRLGPDAIKRILIEKSLLENKLAAETAEKDRAHTRGREQAHRIRYLSRKVRNVKADARNLAARDKKQRQRIKALQKKYKKGKLDLAGLEKALLAEQKKGARLLEYDYIMANPAWAHALTGFTRPQLTRLVGDLEEDDYLERILGPVKTSSGATMSRSHLPAKDILMIFFARLRLNLSLDVVAKMAGISTVTSSLYFHGAGGAVFEFFINKKFKDYPQSQETIWDNVVKTDLTEIVGMYRVSMDGTHIRTRMPYNPGENKQQFCAYKHCHTDLFQILIGADGTTQGVSLASPGSDSDINMILNSSLQSVRGSSARYQDDPQAPLKIIDELNVGDVVLGDKGYVNLVDNMAKRGIRLLVPPVGHGKDTAGNDIQFTPDEGNKAKVIAKLRIVVERLNARIKGYRYTINPSVPTGERAIMVYITAFFSNYRSPLVPRIDANGNAEMTGLGDDDEDVAMDIHNAEPEEEALNPDAGVDAPSDGEAPPAKRQKKN